MSTKPLDLTDVDIIGDLGIPGIAWLLNDVSIFTGMDKILAICQISSSVSIHSCIYYSFCEPSKYCILFI